MPEIVDGNIGPSVDDEAATEFWAALNTGIDWLELAHAEWPGLTGAEKQAWLAANFDTVLLVNLRVLKFIKWLVRRVLHRQSL